MAYALNYPNAPTDPQTSPGTDVRKGLFARMMAGIERAQMVRMRRELQIYSPHLYELLELNLANARTGQSNDRPLSFTK